MEFESFLSATAATASEYLVWKIIQKKYFAAFKVWSVEGRALKRIFILLQ
jgi:hypothetical protein